MIIEDLPATWLFYLEPAAARVRQHVPPVNAQRSPERAGSAHMRDDNEPLDLVVAVGAEECLVVPERHAAVGVAARAKHVGVGEQSVAAEDRVVATHRGQADRLHAMEHGFT